MPSKHGHICICVHDTISSPRGSWEAIVRYCKTKWSKPCYNEMIGRNGERAKLTFKTSYNAGRIDAKQWARIARGHKPAKRPGKTSPITRNSQIWGIAFVRAAREPISPAQWRRMVGVVAWRCWAWGIHPDVGLVGHRTLTRRKSDPWPHTGRRDVIAALRSDVKRAMRKAGRL